MSMWMMRRWASCKLLEPGGEEPQAAGERAEHRLPELGAHFHQRDKGLAADRLQRAVGLRGGVGDARRRSVDQGRLAEHAARAQALDDAPADRNRDPTFDDRVHANALWPS